MDERLNKDLETLIVNDNEGLLHSLIIPEIKLYIEPFYTCNYDCSYCYLGKKSKKEINYTKLYWFLEKKFLPAIDKYIYKHLKDIPQKIIEITLVGGELSIKPLEWNINFIEKIKKIFINYFDYVEINFLTNLFRPASYYIDLAYNILFNEEKNFDFSVCATLHEEFETLENFLKKLIEINENNIDIVGQIFKTKEEIYKNNRNLKSLIDYCFEKNIIRIKYIDQLNYINFFNKHKSLIRPVKCYAYNYKIKPDFTIYHRCELQEMDLFNFKPKLYYFCKRHCACADDEHCFKKELLKK